jgi:hypothetical protein
MKYFKDPSYNGIKVLILAIVLVGAGSFAYSVNKNDSLSGTGQVATRTGTKMPSPGGAAGSGTTTTTGTGGTGGDYPVPCDRSTPFAIAPSVDTSFTPGPLHFDTNGQDAGHFNLVNTSKCDLRITAFQFSLISPAYPTTGWTPIGGVTPPGLKLHIGNSISAPVFGTPLMSPGTSVLRALIFTSPTSTLIIPAGSTQTFALEVSSWNTMPVPSGTVAFKLLAVKAFNVTTAMPYIWSFATSGLPAATVTTTPMTLVNP